MSEGDENEVNDAGLLRSMLRDSEEYYENIANGTNQEEKHCWVCFATEVDDPNAEWTHPCKCKGSTKWVHQACIQRWVDEKQKGNATAEVECPQCGHSYSIQLPYSNVIVATLDAVEKLIQKTCPIFAGGFCVGAIYWTCISFGAVTVMQVVGERQGLEIIEMADPLFLLIVLPLVPLGLVLGKMVRWDEPALRCLRYAVPRIPLCSYVLPAFSADAAIRPGVSDANAAALPPMSDPVSVTRTFCGALMFPTIAAFLGSALFAGRVDSQFRRTLLGGAMVIVDFEEVPVGRAARLDQI